MDNLVVICADVGSIKRKKFGWYGIRSDEQFFSGQRIEDFSDRIAKEIKAGRKVAIGFECPLFVPLREMPEEVNSARDGEGNRSWSASAGSGALATGLVEVLWTMNKVRRLLGQAPRAEFEWTKFIQGNSVFFWEAFVTADAKGIGHEDDAQIAVQCFREALPDPTFANAIVEEKVLSLIGAAALRTGWSNDQSILSKPCLVIKA